VGLEWINPTNFHPEFPRISTRTMIQWKSSRLLVKGLRYYSTNGAVSDHTLRLAIIGSGPAGFYTAWRLLKKLPNATIDMYEALPVPFGLSRFGVAPDHPEVKNCQETLEKVAQSSQFRLVANVNVGRDLALHSLSENYNGVIFAYGSRKDRLLGIPGESLPGVCSARKLVAWYNGLPDYADLNPPLDQAEDVIIIGNGNVAMDVARILSFDVSKFKSTDITEHAYETLKKSKIKRIRVVGRRGLLQSAFTTKEVRELVSDPKVYVEPINPEYIDPYLPFLPILERPLKRVLEVLKKIPNYNELRDADHPLRSLYLDYLKSPIRFYESMNNPKLLSSTEFEINTLIQNDLGDPATTHSTGETISYKSELVYRSIGYRAEPLPGMEEAGISFDPKLGVIPNNLGRVIGPHGPIPGFYVSGWVKSGPTGVIAKTMRESFEVAETLVEDYNSGFIDKQHKAGFDGLKHLIKSRVVDWQDWQKIDKLEIERGRALGKDREKFNKIDDMMKVLG
jgi:adrenodoxin-NADP+ reductase